MTGLLLISVLILGQPCEEAVPVEYPCVGLLIPSEQAAECLLYKDVRYPGALEDLRVCNEKNGLLDKTWKDTSDACIAKADALELQVKKASLISIPFQRQPWFGWAGGSLLAGGAGMILGGFNNEPIRWSGVGVGAAGVGMLLTYFIADAFF